MEKRLEIEIVKTDNTNLIIVNVLKQIIGDTKEYIVENVEDVDYEEFDLSDETKELCRKLFSIAGVFELELHSHSVLVFKENKADWKLLEPQIISVFEKFLNNDEITINKKIWFKVTEKGKSLTHRVSEIQKGSQYYSCSFNVFVQVFGQLSSVSEGGLIDFVEEGKVRLNEPEL